MRFFCVTRSRLEGINRSLRRACAVRDLTFVPVAPGAVWRPLSGGPQAGDLLYRAATGRAAERVEALLLEPGIATFHAHPGFRCTDPLAAFAGAGLPIPRTVFNLVRHPEALRSCVEAVGGFPVVLRPATAEAGEGVLRVDDREQLEQLARRHAGPATLQELVPHDRVLRLIVVGDTVVACEERRPAAGELRSDGPGATRRAVSPPLGAADLAGRALELVGLELGAVDLLVDPQSDLVLAGVEFPCDFASTEETTGADVAGAMLDHLTDQVECAGDPA